jgi:hypothetical protein
MAGNLKRDILSVFGAALVASSPTTAAVTPPVFANVSVIATVSVKDDPQTYTYTYSLLNAAANTLELSGAKLDLKTGPYVADVAAFPAATGFALTLRNTGFAAWGPGDAHRVPPGMAFAGFGLASPEPPTVREMLVDPYLLDYMRAVREDREAHGEELSPEEYDAIELPYILVVKTLGPLAVPIGSFEHWNALIADVAQAGQLGWISDAALLAAVQADLATARQAAAAQDSAAAHVHLQAVMASIQQAAPSQRTAEGYALVLLNAQVLDRWLPYPCEPKLTLSPMSATLPVGARHTATASLVNLADGQPLADQYVQIAVTSGPNTGLIGEGNTDATGHVALSYVGTALGEDGIEAHTKVLDLRAGGQGASSSCYASNNFSGLAHVKWDGGPDLAITLFSPPLLISGPGKELFLFEETSNLGNLAAGASTTRYYISPTQPVDPNTAVTLGERSVPLLAPGEASRVEMQRYTVPTNLAPGTYYLAACADADCAVVETDETNNCSFASLANRVAIIPMVPATSPPDCSQARAVPDLLWPPNHKLVTIAIGGVTDPDNDPITITVTAITQDEPTNGLGDGDTTPDGFGVGTAQAQVRAERSGTGNGRVYVISFRADDGKGGSCLGAVKVGVPHDKKDTPIDDGQRFESTRQ